MTVITNQPWWKTMHVTLNSQLEIHPLVIIFLSIPPLHPFIQFQFQPSITHLSHHPFFNQLIHPSIHLSIPSICPSHHPFFNSIHPFFNSIHPSIFQFHPSIVCVCANCMYVYIYLHVCLQMYMYTLVYFSPPLKTIEVQVQVCVCLREWNSSITICRFLRSGRLSRESEGTQSNKPETRHLACRLDCLGCTLHQSVCVCVCVCILTKNV